MEELEPIPRHDPPFSDEQVRSLLANQDQWFERGSALYKAANRLLEDLENQPAREPVIVGRPVATDFSDEKIHRVRREIVPAMLFAMAIECWLKGFLVWELPRQSHKTRKEWEEIVHEGITFEDLNEAYLIAITQGFKKPEAIAKEGELKAQQAAEDDARAARVKEHVRHDLVRLARAAGLEPHARAHDFEYLEFLSTAIITGRYATHFKAEKIIPWADTASDRRRWDSLCGAIFARHDELLEKKGRHG